MGISWGEILRFKGLAFASGGKFKACFCDYETLAQGTASACATAADYKVEIGTVHVSGVSCLIEEKKFQRGVCVEQFHGGLRCYPTRADVPVLTPPEPDAVATPPPTAPDVLSTWCFYGPEEQTRDD